MLLITLSNADALISIIIAALSKLIIAVADDDCSLPTAMAAT
jgi:hypothetical protein